MRGSSNGFGDCLGWILVFLAKITESNCVASLKGFGAQVFGAKFRLSHAASGVQSDRRNQTQVESPQVVGSDLGSREVPACRECFALCGSLW